MVKATLDKSTYNAGDTMTLTVVTSAGDRDVFTAQPGSVTVDVDGDGPIAPVTVPFTSQVKSPTPAAIKVSDSSGRVWTSVSDDGLTAVYTSKA